MEEEEEGRVATISKERYRLRGLVMGCLGEGERGGGGENGREGKEENGKEELRSTERERERERNTRREKMIMSIDYLKHRSTSR